MHSVWRCPTQRVLAQELSGSLNVAGHCLAGLKKAVQPMGRMACPLLTGPGMQV